MENKKGWMTLEVDKLVSAGWNYKKDDEEKAEKLLLNIKRNGQIENIIIRDLGDGTFEVVNGNHRLTAFQKLGYSEVMCFSLGEISDAQAKRVAIETNETKFDTDSIKLAERMTEILEEFSVEELSETMPYSVDDIKGMKDLLDFDWSGSDGDDKNDKKKKDLKEPEYIECPHCGGKFLKE